MPPSLPASRPQSRPLNKQTYSERDIALAGAFVILDRDGSVRVERGFVRPEDEPQSKAKKKNGKADKADGPAPLSDKLVAELTAYRTSALRNEFALAAGADVQRPGSCEQLDRPSAIDRPAAQITQQENRRLAPVEQRRRFLRKRNGRRRGSCSLSIRRARLGAPAPRDKDHDRASRKCRSERMA